MYYTTDLCLTANQLKKEKREQCSCTEVSVYVVHILSTVETEYTYTPVRLEALFQSHRSSFVTRACQDLKSNFPCERPLSRSVSNVS